jgi:hypothetical protein
MVVAAGRGVTGASAIAGTIACAPVTDRCLRLREPRLGPALDD